jgi:anti-sigma factor RsiW
VSDHIGDDAELYALGMLDDARRGAVDAHAAACDACARLLGEAEEAVLGLASASPRVEPSGGLAARIKAIAETRDASKASARFVTVPRSTWFAGLAAAAVLVIALCGAFYRNVTLNDALTAQRLAVTTMVHAHFLHASMTVLPAGGAMAAKVVYARDGSWLYVLVDHPEGPVDVSLVESGSRIDAGRAVASGDTATLFVRPASRPQNVELTRDGVVLARVALTY